MTLKKVALLVFIQTIFLFAATAQHKEYFPDPDPTIRQKLEDWQDLKFGLLMHWGPYSQWGVVESWSICPEDVGWATGARMNKFNDMPYFDYLKKYENLQTTFNPTKFNPEKWASAAKEAGMKYVVFTTKHHDGFCMFDTKTTDYKITNSKTPFSTNEKANVTKEIFDAFRKENLWVGAYFSKPDWHSDYYWWDRFPPIDRNPNYPITKHPEQWKKFVDFTHTQIDELMSGYGKIDILWLDGGWVRKKTPEQEKEDYIKNFAENSFGVNGQNQDIDMPRLVKEARAKQPGLIVVDREVPGPQQNYLTPEQHIPEEGLPYPWETCMTMGSSWSYSPTDVYKPTDEIIEKLIDIISKGGNYLLNIGPKPDGEWADTAYKRLHEIGQWMKINGEAVYGTRMNDVIEEGQDIRFTKSKDGKTKFVYLFNYPKDKITLNKITFDKKASVQMLGTNKKLKWKQKDAGIEIQIPAKMQSASEHVWVLKIQS